MRFALYRLVGEGLLADHARSGLYVPLLMEVALRDLYDWMERLLLIACEMGPMPIASARIRVVDAGAVEEDLLKPTWKLFDAIARSTGHRYLHDAVKRTNDRLAPIRKAGQQGQIHFPPVDAQEAAIGRLLLKSLANRTVETRLKPQPDSASRCRSCTA